MPSFSHELLVDLFKRRPGLGREVLRAAEGPTLPEGVAEIGSTDLTQVTSPAYAADSVELIRGEHDQIEAALIVEVQLRIDPQKRFSWPVYVAALRAMHGCPAILLVVTPSERVAQWARVRIDLGHPRFCLEPVVVSFGSIPRVGDVGSARQIPELAVLSALAHPDDEGVAWAALDAVSALADDRVKLYVDVIWAALVDPVRAALEARMQKHQYQSDFARKYYQEGRDEEREEGRERLRRAVLAIATAKIGALSPELTERVRGLGDLAALERLLIEIGQARDAEAARALLARVGT